LAMPIERIRDLFERGIDRRIEEVIKVDQNDEGILLDEIEEYVVTDAIRHYYASILDRYWETPNKPHECHGALQNRPRMGASKPASEVGSCIPHGARPFQA
jgi:hypothetical protein